VASFSAAGPVFENRFIGRRVYGENRIGHALPPLLSKHPKFITMGKVTQKAVHARMGLFRKHKKNRESRFSATFPAFIL
jgi:hypothetical protein